MDIVWTVREGTIDGTIVGTGELDAIAQGSPADSIIDLTPETTYFLTDVIGTVEGKDPSNPATPLEFTTLEPPAPPPPPPTFEPTPPPTFEPTPPPSFPPTPPPSFPPTTQPPTFTPGEITASSSRVIDVSGAIDVGYPVRGAQSYTVSWNLNGGTNPGGQFNFSTTSALSGTIINSPGTPVLDGYSFIG
jgi:hypothetical protein